MTDALARELQRVAEVDVLLVALDFDGVLAPLVDEPGASRMLPEARAALVALAALPRTRVALVSGRGLDDLRAVGEAATGWLLAGSHGEEFDVGDGPVPAPVDEAVRADLIARLEHAVAGLAGIRIERKPHGAAVHSRSADASAAERAQAAAVAAIDDLPGLKRRFGRDVLEVSLSTATKADAIEALRREAGASAVVFAGDDVTDEDALAALHPLDLGVKVGDAETVARHRVADPDAFARLLADLAGRRAATVNSTGVDVSGGPSTAR
ncbi:trehalose-phosphatase [Arenivirga flava]|uniref:Trehalose 6-phosphate phosphatase n=1 Tax=Arenivirga flava TaxID=1930060 RepID=A0AA37UCI4_9MICO|nr:trehalose-phosphatase [Arenivirga flava]GMA27954.1 hypothetical protein GCM10025874_12070 [Arenivirga flava]